jgi:hypothetical protein
MRRATVFLASSLAAAIVAGAFLYDRDPPADPSQAAPNQSAAEVARQADQLPAPSTAATEQNVSLPSPPPARAVRSTTTEPDERGMRRRGPPRDEATILAERKALLVREIREGYSLLLEDLDLTAQQAEDLIAALADLQLDSAWLSDRDSSFEKRGRTIGAQERHERLAAAIGERKLDEFLVLEVDLAAYGETQQIALLLGRKGTPLSETQRDAMFDILVEVRDRYPYTPPDFDPSSLAYIEEHLAWMDDFDRHVMELAPSVLSATQVAHLSDEYQWMARQRIDSIEMQTKRRAERPGGGVGWAVPARWNGH